MSVIKIGNLIDWSPWPAGRMLPLAKDKGRSIRLEVICQAATEFRVWTEQEYVDKADGQLLAVLPDGGNHILEFWAEGTILVGATSDGEVLCYCSENSQWWVEYDGEVSFTKPYERPHVDPAIRAMQLVMMQNMQAMEERINRGFRRLQAPQQPVATTVKEKKEGKQPDDGDGDKEAPGGAEPPAGQKPPAGEPVKPQAKGAGSGVQSPASGEGG